MLYLAYILTILLFLGPTILALIGWPIEGDRVEAQHYHPAFYILTIFFIFRSFSKKNLAPEITKYTIYILITCYFAFIAGRFIKGGGGMNALVMNIITPALYAFFFAQQDIVSYKSRIKKLVILLYCINSIIAIYERINLHNLFPITLIYSHIDFTISSEWDHGLFRSSALLGHPLTNALLISIIMGFILTTNTIKIKTKYCLYALGFISLLCFNARGATLITVFSLITYFFKQVLSHKIKIKTKLLIITLFVILGVSIFYLISMGYGGRFFEHSVTEDSSILARFQAWELIKDSSEILICGIPNIEQYAIRIIGTPHIENWFILMTLQIGLIFTILFIIYFIKILKFHLIKFPTFDKVIVLSVFILISSTNNSLACGVPAISMFIICCFAFTPSLKK